MQATDISNRTVAVATPVPHPFPYQGSKRQLAPFVLGQLPIPKTRLIEPFAGSAAISIRAAASGMYSAYWLNDSDPALMRLWRAILETPEQLCERYAILWEQQFAAPKTHFYEVRDRFNIHGAPEDLLFLLARCVKAAVRYNDRGEFNNSADKRRAGMKPRTMRRNILAVSQLLAGKTEISTLHYRSILSSATKDDVVYMDPPYQGVCGNRDPRYRKPVSYDEFVDALTDLNKRHVPFVISYDGRRGSQEYGLPLPDSLNLRRLHVRAGRSSQSTLIGRDDVTVESLYLSQDIWCALDAQSELIPEQSSLDLIG